MSEYRPPLMAVTVDVATAPDFELAFDHHSVLSDAIEAAGL